MAQWPFAARQSFNQAASPPTLRAIPQAPWLATYVAPHALTGRCPPTTTQGVRLRLTAFRSASIQARCSLPRSNRCSAEFAGWLYDPNGGSMGWNGASTHCSPTKEMP